MVCLHIFSHLTPGPGTAFINDESVRAVQLVAETNPGLSTTLTTPDTFGLLASDVNNILNVELAPPSVERLYLICRSLLAESGQLLSSPYQTTCKVLAESIAIEGTL